jgi:hypothetical protein
MTPMRTQFAEYVAPSALAGADVPFAHWTVVRDA